MNTSRLFVLWAKRDADDQFHPLPCHLIDVASVTEAIWLHVLPDPARQYLADEFGIEPASAACWIPFLAGLHDLGKASPAFQYRWPKLAPKANELGLPTTRFFDGAPHGSVTAKTLPEILDADFGISRSIAVSISLALGGHHGVIPSGADLSRLNQEAVGQALWQRVRRDLTLLLAELFQVQNVSTPASCSIAGLMVFAGLVSVADWVGSDSTFFPYTAADRTISTLDLTSYVDDARQRAIDALGQLGWIGIAGTPERRSFTDLFPGFEPNPLQHEVIRLSDFAEQGQSLVIVEAPMGEGKTEAAFFLSDAWRAQPGYRGSYTALPTQATSNQMFSRVRHFLGERYPDDVVNLQLLHGHAALSSEFELLRQGAYRLRPEITDETQPQTGSVVATEWFTYRKRGLLAPFGVGTVDQTLLAILQTRHVFVRLFGLFHKTVIFDEVHAYDTYMTELLERLLEWLAAMGSSAIILSATLPASRRNALLDAWERGTSGRHSQVERPEKFASYPRLSWRTPDGIGSTSFDTSSRSQKDLQLAWVDMNIPESGEAFHLGELLSANLDEGGCAAVICNTVRRAQAVYQALKSYFPGIADDGHPELDLLHARYLFENRQSREQRALIRFGKAGTLVETPHGVREVQRPHRAVLVATQVIEQSLDLDFDLMVSDLAPIDLLLQRSGRLHRHERSSRPADVHKPVLWIGQPAVADPIPEFEPGSAVVYDEHILLRTWLTLRGRPQIRIPDEVEELIEAVYNDRPCPPDHPDPIQQHWKATRQQQEQKREEERQEARQRWLKGPSARASIGQMMSDPREEDAPDLHQTFQALTRLTGPTVQVVILHDTPNGSAFDPEGREVIHLTSPPAIDHVRRLLQRSVTLSDPRVVFALRDEPPPSGWQRSAHLRQHRLLRLDAEGSATVGTYRVTLDPELGVIVSSA